jgi:hypothetical protein
MKDYNLKQYQKILNAFFALKETSIEDTIQRKMINREHQSQLINGIVTRTWGVDH